MKNTCRLALAIPALGSLLGAQDILFYRFDDAYGTKAVNYAAGSMIAPAQGTIVSGLPNAPASSWVPGKFGAALSAGLSVAQFNRLDTGWVPNTFSGSFSYALWLKFRPQTLPSLWYIFGSPTSFAFRVYSGSSGRILTTGFGQTITSAAVVHTLAQAGWVHLAFVVDTVNSTCTYYVNGALDSSFALTVTPTWTSTVPFTVGQQLTSSSGSVYDIDEFLFTKRILGAAEVAALAGRSRAADGAYGGGCGGLTLGSNNGPPATGKVTYQLTVTSSAAHAFAVGVGSNRASLGAIPLPFDLSNIFPTIGTCMLDSSVDLFWIAGAKSTGTTHVGFPIPNFTSLDGITLFLQTAGFAPTSVIQLSNAFSVGIGQ
jgi:hypothetical protein